MPKTGRIDCLFPDAPVRLTFFEYMQRVLYHPEAGYYTTRESIFGAAGDYYTSFYVHPIAAELLAEQFAQLWTACGRPASFALIEYGPGEGLFARQALDYARRLQPDFWKAIRYHGIDVHSKYSSAAASEEPAAAVAGVVFSNEFFDAWPVHRLVARDGDWLEIFVEVSPLNVREVEDSVSDASLLEYVRHYGIRARQGQQVEIRRGVEDWYRRVFSYLQAGAIFTVDYGDRAPELYSRSRRDGTLMCYDRHRAHSDPYARPGEQDITAHVNFSELEEAGEQQGFSSAGLSSQRRFLLDRGLLQRLEDDPAFQGDNVEGLQQRLRVKSLLVPGGISDTFKVLVQERRPGMVV
ncbi:MAG: class I SAM-dependent methyltransferase [Acidobacteriota bacterium]